MASTLDTLTRRATRLLATDSYLPGRAHIASILGERIFHTVIETMTERYTGGVGRCTALALAANLFTVAGMTARSHGCRMVSASLIGTWFDGGCRVMCEHDHLGVNHAVKPSYDAGVR